jgi:hypothetical protein
LADSAIPAEADDVDSSLTVDIGDLSISREHPERTAEHKTGG